MCRISCNENQYLMTFEMMVLTVSVFRAQENIREGICI